MGHSLQVNNSINEVIRRMTTTPQQDDTETNVVSHVSLCSPRDSTDGILVHAVEHICRMYALYHSPNEVLLQTPRSLETAYVCCEHDYSYVM